MFYERHIEELDANLQPLLHDEFFFVNVGANDGIMNDPIYPFIEKYGWRGIAIEPVPHVFEQLAANYRDLEGVALERVAIADRPRPFWYVRPGSGSAEFAVQQIGSLKEEYVRDSLLRLRMVPNVGPTYVGDTAPIHDDTDNQGPLVVDGVETFVEQLDVDCVPFNELMERHGVDHVDFLNIDAEGCDFEILQSIDFTRFAPVLLCIELAALSDQELAGLDEMINRFGYETLQNLGIHSRIYQRVDLEASRKPPV
jgi:FkbM family methyltransferase